MEDWNFVNNSGQGKDIEIPKEVKRFSWGAFFFGWIWGLFNRSYLTLIWLAVSVLSFVIAFALGLIAGISGDKAVAGLMFLLISLVSIIANVGDIALSIWFGIKGNDWAWQNKKWDSLKHFHDVQRIWAIVGTVLLGVGVVAVAALTLPSLLMNTYKAQNRAMILKSLSIISQATLMNEAMENKCKDLSSAGLASCFGEQPIGSAKGNKFEMADGNILEFTGDGSCTNKGSCYVKIITPKNAHETVGLYIDKGYIKVNSEDSEKVENKYRRNK